MSNTINIFSLLGEAKPETQVKNLSGQFDYNKAQILFLTKMDAIEYDNLIYDTGLNWLEQMVKFVDLPTIIDNKFFWQWWRYQWNCDDCKFLPHIYETQKSKLWMYRVMHQYVFDLTEQAAKNLLEDFKSFLNDFLKAAKEDESKTQQK